MTSNVLSCFVCLRLPLFTTYSTLEVRDRKTYIFLSLFPFEDSGHCFILSYTEYLQISQTVDEIQLPQSDIQLRTNFTTQFDHHIIFLNKHILQYTIYYIVYYTYV